MSKEYNAYTDREDMNERERWADEVLNSFSGIERATPGDGLFDKIRMELPEQEEHVILNRHLGWVAMIASVVIGFNLYVLTLDKQTDFVDVYTEHSAYSLQSNFNIYAD